MASSAVAALIVAAAVVFGGAGTAIAGRHRVVILEFRGPGAEKFHADVVKIVRKTHTVVGVQKWDSAAEELGATKINSKNVKRVARKLNVDGVIVGEIEKRRDRYILRIKVREGRSGDYTGNPIEATSGDMRLDAHATRDLKDELLDTIDTLDPAVSAGDDEDDDRGDRARDRGRDDDDEGATGRDDDDRGGRARDRDRDDEDRDRDRDVEENDRGSRSKGKDRGKDRDEDEDRDSRASTKGKDKDRGKDRADEEDEDEDRASDRDKDRASDKGKGKDKDRGKGKAPPEDDEDMGGTRTSDGEDEENPLGGKGKGFVRGKDKDRTANRDKDRAAEEDGGGDDVRDVSRDEEDGDKDRDEDRDKDRDDDDDRVAARDDEDGGDGDGDVRDRGEPEEDDGVDHTSPANRAVDAVLGLSVMRRTLDFQVEAGLTNRPQGYRGAPVAGFYLDADIYPLALNKRNHSITKNLGLTVIADRVIKINSSVGGVKLPSKQYHYGVGVVFRYPLGPALVTAHLRYSKLGFSITHDPAVMVDVPNVGYTVIDPGVGVVYPIGKLAIGADVAFMLIPNTGPIQAKSQYGAATVTGVDGEAHVDYLITPKIFARAAFHFMTIGFKFKGNGTMTTDRDGDLEQDVFGARDTYLGGFVTGGYLF